MKNIIEGKAYVLGDNIDTDQIIPAMHLVYKVDDPEELKLYGKYAMSGLPSKVYKKFPFIEDGDYKSSYNIMIAGKNFGCGSSREHAPLALKESGVKAIVSENYARIFYRNSVDGGFLIPFETPIKLTDKISTGDKLIIDTENGILKNITTNKRYILKSLGNAGEIIKAGGLFSYAKKQGYII